MFAMTVEKMDCFGRCPRKDGGGLDCFGDKSPRKDGKGKSSLRSPLGLWQSIYQNHQWRPIIAIARFCDGVNRGNLAVKKLNKNGNQDGGKLAESIIDSKYIKGDIQ